MYTHLNGSFLKWLSFSILLLVVVGCSAQDSGEKITLASPTSSATTALTSDAIQAQEAANPGEVVDQADELLSTITPISPGLPQLNTSSPQAAVMSTPTPDTRLPPEEWRDWPYIPTVSARAKEIYQQGIAMGNNPNHFSVVGDCQAIPFVFLGTYDRKDYHLDGANRHLQETIDHFAGSFNREGMAVRGGFTAPSLLSPLQADPNVCKPGETPLDCEFRVYNPSILIISLETWADPTTIERYGFYLRQIIDIAIEHGVLPILATKADMAEVGDGKHYINPAIARLAYEYDLPLFNFWRSAQFLPNFGIDSEREGFHLSQEGFNLKNLMALQTLDVVWRAVTDQEMVSTPIPTLTSSPIPTQTPTQKRTPTLVPTPTALPICDPQIEEAVECVVFGLMVQGENGIHPDGVYLYDLAGNQIMKAYEAGYNLQDLSPDGKQLLVNKDSSLFVGRVNGQQTKLITDDFFALGKQGAYWMPDGTGIVLIADRDGYNAIWLYDSFENSWQALTGPGEDPIYLYPSNQEDVVYYEKGSCSAKDFCEREGVWKTALDGGESEALESLMKPAYSPDTTSVAFIDPDFNPTGSQNVYPYQLLVEKLDQPLISRRNAIIPPARGFMVSARLLSYYWSPDSTKVFALVDDYSDYFENSLVLRSLVFDLRYGLLLEYDKLYGAYGSLQPQAVWSPDGDRVLIAAPGMLENGEYRLNFFLVFMQPRSLLTLSENVDLAGSAYQYMTNLYWVAPDQ